MVARRGEEMRPDAQLRYLVLTGVCAVVLMLLILDHKKDSAVRYLPVQPGSRWSSQKCCLDDIDPSLDGDVIRITNWTTKMKRQIWMQEGNASFIDCPNLQPWMKCWYSSKAAAYNQSHAVLFRGQHVFRQALPVHRPIGQKWILFETEPPTKLWGPHLNYSSPVWKAFNMTSTYTLDSSVSQHIFRQKCTLNPHWKRSSENYAKGKSGVAVGSSAIVIPLVRGKCTSKN
jgi:hypothetical protein